MLGIRRLLALLALAAASNAAASNVFVVWDQGGGFYTDIPFAVAQAQDGDVILIRPGHYSVLWNDGKSLTFIGDSSYATPAAQEVVVGELLLNGGPERVVSVRHVRVDPIASPQPVLVSGLASILLEDCYLGGGTNINAPHQALFVSNMNRLTMVRCTIVGRSASTVLGSGATPAIVLCTPQGGWASVFAFDCVFAGGSGSDGVPSPSFFPPIAGAPAVRLGCQPSLLYAESCLITGGDGGDGALGPFGSCVAGTAGGPSLYFDVNSTSATKVFAVNTQLDGGAPGAGAGTCGGGLGPKVIDGPGFGDVYSLSMPEHGFVAGSPVREGGSLSLSIDGQPGELAYLIVSSAHTALFLVDLLSVVAPVAPVLVLPLGVLPPSGAMVSQTTIGDLGVEGTVLVMQPVLISLPLLSAKLPEASAVVLLDQAF